MATSASMPSAVPADTGRTAPDDGSEPVSGPLPEPCVFIVDDDASVLEWLEAILRHAGHRVAAFATARAFLAACGEDMSGCLVLDIRMPDMSGLELHAELKRRGNLLPVIFVTGHADVPMAVAAMRSGAVDFLEKPFKEEEIVDRVRQALALDAARQGERAGHAALRARYAGLTPREREVLALVVGGKANKVIATDLGLSQRTVEIHRARVMDKMGADSLAHLVHMVCELEEPPGEPR